MANVLIASLGESPVVVTGMVNVLRARGVALDQLRILYPESGDRLIQRGFELVAAHLRRQLSVEGLPLPFDDARNREQCLAFLKILSECLNQHARQGDQIYLSIAGGRKHLAALMSVPALFFNNIAGIYHLHDREEANPRRQYPIRQLERLSAAFFRRRLDQPADRFTLVELPQTKLAEADRLRRWLVEQERDDSAPPVAVTAAIDSFYDELFNDRYRDSRRLPLRLSRTAYRQYLEMLEQAAARRETIDNYLSAMRNPFLLANPARLSARQPDPNPGHRQQGDGTPLEHRCYRQRHHAERIFYYSQPNAPDRTADNDVREVIVTCLPEPGDDDRDTLATWAERPDIDAIHSLEELPERPLTLIAPLGESPMVITQTVVLLQARNLSVQAVWVVYPEQSEPVRAGALLLDEVCERRGLTLHRHPLPIADLDSDEARDHFVAGMRAALAAARTEQPKASPALLIAGGRKGMSALALHVAQSAGVQSIYHSTIDDPAREEAIQQRYEAIKSEPTRRQVTFMFLEDQNLSDFNLVEVPVIALGRPD